MKLDPDTWARFLAAICKQAIHDYHTGWRQHGYPDATVFLQEAGLLRSDGTLGRPERDEDRADLRFRTAA
jgi:hypothetical protein